MLPSQQRAFRGNDDLDYDDEQRCAEHEREIIPNETSDFDGERHMQQRRPPPFFRPTRAWTAWRPITSSTGR